MMTRRLARSYWRIEGACCLCLQWPVIWRRGTWIWRKQNFRNVCNYVPIRTTSYPRKLVSFSTQLWEIYMRHRNV